MLGPAEAAIKAFVAANYSDLTIRWAGDEQPAERDAGEAYIEAEVIGGTNRLHAFGTPGARLFVHPGSIRFYIYSPINQGTANARATADQLAQFMELAEFGTPPEIVRTLEFSSDSGVASDETGNFIILMCRVPFDFYYLN